MPDRWPALALAESGLSGLEQALWTSRRGVRQHKPPLRPLSVGPQRGAKTTPQTILGGQQLAKVAQEAARTVAVAHATVLATPRRPQTGFC